MSRKGILVNEIDRDRYSRIANMNIDEKQVTFPNFTPRITNKDELSSLVSTLTLFPLDYVDAFTVRLDDQPNEIFKNVLS